MRENASLRDCWAKFHKDGRPLAPKKDVPARNIEEESVPLGGFDICAVDVEPIELCPVFTVPDPWVESSDPWCKTYRPTTTTCGNTSIQCRLCAEAGVYTGFGVVEPRAAEPMGNKLREGTTTGLIHSEKSPTPLKKEGKPTIAYSVPIQKNC